MLQYGYGNQMEAYEEIQSLDLDGEEQGILENAQDKWSDDYEMVLCYMNMNANLKAMKI